MRRGGVNVGCRDDTRLALCDAFVSAPSVSVSVCACRVDVCCCSMRPSLFPLLLGKRRYNIKLWKTFTDCFNCLPVAAIIDEKIFCV